MKTIEIRIDRVSKIRVPITPNFLHVDGTAIPIANVSEAGLQAVAKAWTEDLLAKAKRKRKGA